MSPSCDASPLHVARRDGVLRSAVGHPAFRRGAQHRQRVLDLFSDEIAQLEAFANEALICI